MYTKDTPDTLSIRKARVAIAVFFLFRDSTSQHGRHEFRPCKNNYNSMMLL